MALAPELVHKKLRVASGRFRWARAGRYLISGLAVSLSSVALFLLVDTQFHLGALGRWVGFLSIFAPVIGGVIKAVPAFLQPLPEMAMARRIEEACAGAGNTLVNAVQFDRELRPDSALRNAVFNELSDPFSRVNWTQVFDLSLLRRLGVALGAVALVVFGWALVRPAAFANSVARVILPAGNIAPLTRTRLLKLEPGTTGVSHGSELTLGLELSGDVPRSAWVRFRELGGSWQRELLSHEVGTANFSFRWKAVRQPMEYDVEAGDLQTPAYQVSVRARTAIKTRTADIVPPAYTKLPKRTVSGFAALEGVVPGSKATFNFDFNNPVEALTVTGEKGQSLPASRSGNTHWTLPITVAANQRLTLAFRGAGENGTETLLITTKADEPPKLAITEPREGRELLADAGSALEVQFTASDDFALGHVGLYRSTPQKSDAELVQDFLPAGGQKTFIGTARVPLTDYLTGKERQATFCVVASDTNNATGPGVTISRALTVSLATPEKLQQQAAEAAGKLDAGLHELIKLQAANLQATQATSSTADPTAAALTALLNRQVTVNDSGRELAANALSFAPRVSGVLRFLVQQEMPAAVLALRDAGGAPAAKRAELLGEAVRLESLILVRLQGAPSQADEEGRRAEIQSLIAGVDGLLRAQRSISKDTTNASASAAEGLSDRQDKLADQSVKVRKDVERNAGNAALGDPDLRARLGKIAGMFGEYKIYEGMLAAADVLGAKGFSAALEKQGSIVANLARMVELLNQWQLAQAGIQGDKMRKEAEKMKAKLDALASLQRDVVEKSKELQRKDQFSADDRSTAEEIQRTKDLMAQVVEKMLTDANIFPDMNISNELRTQLTTVFEDVKQTDLDSIANNQLKPGDIPVQKEDELLKAIEETKKIPEDMEMYLPNSSNTANWLLENFDKTEIPNLENLPLPDEFTDVIGDLQKEQQSIEDKVQGAASNQVILAMQQGGPILDGPQDGYSAQGKSGNQRPMDIEQSGRSSGGREGESDGEMVGKVADDLEGRKTKARRTNDAMQSGNVEDHSGKEADAKATGGGKASGFSQREGMDGQAPVRGSKAPRQAANSALEAAQALIAEKTSKKAAAASLLFLRSDKLSGVAGLMEESTTALREGRLADFQGLHKKIMAQLSAAKGEITAGRVLSLATGDATKKSNQQMLGGGEGEAPASYRDRVADYYRALADGK